MSGTTTKKKRPPPAPTPASTSQANVITSLLDSYEFLAPHEYSEKTIGIQAFLLRKSVSDINFSDVIEDSDKRSRQGPTTSCVELLEDKRRNLPEIDASVEKCLMLNRLIAYIKQSPAQFTSLLSDIRLDIQTNMNDNQTGQNPIDFRKREMDFNTRRNAQEIRRLFYHSQADAKNPPNLVYLQNRTTEQLEYITKQMARDPKSRPALSKELESIFRSSFMIVAQPHSGVNPVTIYERRGPGEYTAKISVTIISLLHDFTQLHPNLIELYDIEPSLCPASPYYKLEEPRTISWKTCQIQTMAGGKPRTFLCAELSIITIEQASKTDTRVRFAQLLHSFIFAIKLQLNLVDNSKPSVYQFALESLPFSIGAHNNQIPQLLTRVLLDDIRRFTKSTIVDVKVIQNYVQRYFIHRTGVRPSDCVNIYLEQELNKAMTQRSNSESLDDIYLDFLANFVYQVEFMAKHPVLAMFHADGLFLGICNSERAAEAIVQSSMSHSPVIGLRFNSIRIDYSTMAAPSAGPRAIKLSPCAVRVDIYNDRTKKIQNRTFDSSILATDISKFVSSAETDEASRIYVLSSFDDRTNAKSYHSFKEFSKYDHKRLQEICKSDEKYKPVTDLVDNAHDGNTDEDPSNQNHNNHDIFPFGPNSVDSIPSVTPSIFDEQNSNGYTPLSQDSSMHNVLSPINVLSPSASSQHQPSPLPTPYANDPEALLKYVLSQPTLAEQVARQFNNGISNPTNLAGSSPMPYQMAPSPYPTQMPMQNPSQRPTTFQLSSVQTPMYQQPTPVFYPTPVPYPTSPTQPYFSPQYHQQDLQQQQRTISPSVVHYMPPHPNQTTFIPQTSHMPIFSAHNTHHIQPQFVEQMHICSLSDSNRNQMRPTLHSQLSATQDMPIDSFDELQDILSDPSLDQMLEETTSPQATVNNA